MNARIRDQSKIILFDGMCNLCTGSVQFILKREKQPVFRFASIQSETGGALLDFYGLQEGRNNSVIYVENGTVFFGSTAALKIGGHLIDPWPAISRAGLWIPRPVRDWVYDQIAKNRYRWFGKRDVCLAPTERLSARFL